MEGTEGLVPPASLIAGAACWWTGWTAGEPALAGPGILTAVQAAAMAGHDGGQRTGRITAVAAVTMILWSLWYGAAGGEPANGQVLRTLAGSLWYTGGAALTAAGIVVLTTAGRAILRMWRAGRGDRRAAPKAG